MPKNKIKLIITIIIGLIIITILGFYLLKSNQKTETVSIINPFPSGDLINNEIDLNDNLDFEKYWENVKSLSNFYLSDGKQINLKGSINRLINFPVEIISFYYENNIFNLYYLIKGTGNIAEIKINNGIATNNLISSAIFPNVYNQENDFDLSRKNIIIQYTEDFLNRQNVFLSKNTDDKFDIKKVDERIINFSISPNQKNIFYLIDQDKEIRGFVSDFDFNLQQIIFNSPIKNWNISWLNNESVLILNKPSFYKNGYLYLINIKTGEKQKLLGSFKGLNILPKVNSDLILINYYDDNNKLITEIFNTKTKTREKLGISTFSDKCFWNNDLIYCAVPENKDNDLLIIDDWYKGELLTTDTLWSVNSESLVEKNFFELTENNFDISKIIIKQNQMIIKNRDDDSIYLITYSDLKEDSDNKQEKEESSEFIDE